MKGRIIYKDIISGKILSSSFLYSHSVSIDDLKSALFSGFSYCYVDFFNKFKFLYFVDVETGAVIFDHVDWKLCGYPT